MSPDSPSDDAQDPARSPATRRRVIKAAATAVAVAALAPTARGTAAAQAATASDFAEVSRFLTDKPDLDATLRQRLLETFIATDAGFAEKLRALATVISSPGVTPQTLAARLRADAVDLVDMPGAILSGWYLGIVGAGKDAVCVTFTGGLANQLVADVLTPPSYAYGVYGSWKARPA